MSWDFNDKEPIYLQIVNKMQNKILSGEYKAGDKIESVRDLASIAGVNPNTMQKALIDMEALGLIVTQRTLGKFITDDDDMINKIRKANVDEKIDIFIKDISGLGYKIEDIVPMLYEKGIDTDSTDKIKNLKELMKEENYERNDIGM